MWLDSKILLVYRENELLGNQTTVRGGIVLAELHAIVFMGTAKAFGRF